MKKRTAACTCDDGQYHDHCKTCNCKVVKGGKDPECIACYSTRLYGPWDGKVTAAPKICNTTAR